MPRIDHIDQPWAKKVILFRWARAVFHERTEIAGFSLELYESLQLKARKTHLIQHKINEMAVVQCELIKALGDPFLAAQLGNAVLTTKAG
jgi:hypothetical protein